MTKQEIQQKPQAQAVLAEFATKYGLDPDEMGATLVNTVFKGKQKPSKAQVYALLIVANELGLNPWSKQIYAFPDKGGGIIPMVAADGWYKILAEHPQTNGCPTEHIRDESGKIIGCRATLYRKDWEYPLTVEEWVDECKRNTEPWRNQPGRMIRHRAVSQAVRIGLGIGAVYTPDEAEQIYDAQYEVAGRSTATPSGSTDAFNEAISARAAEPDEPLPVPRFETDDDGSQWEVIADENGEEIRIPVEAYEEEA